jgi:GPI mannosyltransferase 3
MKSYLIWIIIIFGSILRLIYAATELTVVYPDEHFQVLEAANWVVNGFGWLTWEWYKGVRSWFVPSLYMPVLYGLKAFGIQGGPISIYACRVLSAFFSCISLWRFWILLRERGLGQISQFITVGLMAFSGSMVIWSATTFTETWAACALMIGMPTVVSSLKSDNKKLWMIAGALIGLTFPMRIQLLPWAATLGLIFLFGKRERKLIPAFVLGFLIPVMCQGILDWVTWGKPFFSSYAYIKVAVVGGVVDLNGVSPWYTYFSIVPKNLGWLFIEIFVACLVFGLFTRRIRWQKQDLWIVLPAVSVIALIC